MLLRLARRTAGVIRPGLPAKPPPRSRASGLVLVLLLVGCSTPAPVFEPTYAGVVTSTERTPSDVTYNFANGERLTLSIRDIRWLNGSPPDGHLLLSGTAPTTWVAAAPGDIDGPAGLRPCYSISGRTWDRGDHLEIAYESNDGPVTLIIDKAAAWTSPGIRDGEELLGKATCLNATGAAIARH